MSLSSRTPTWPFPAASAHHSAGGLCAHMLQRGLPPDCFSQCSLLFSLAVLNTSAIYSFFLLLSNRPLHSLNPCLFTYSCFGGQGCWKEGRKTQFWLEWNNSFLGHSWMPWTFLKSGIVLGRAKAAVKETIARRICGKCMQVADTQTRPL